VQKQRHHTVAEVIRWLEDQHQDAYVYAYEGEITGIVVQSPMEPYLECHPHYSEEEDESNHEVIASH